MLNMLSMVILQMIGINKPFTLCLKNNYIDYILDKLKPTFTDT